MGSRCPYGPTSHDCQVRAQSSWTDAVWPDYPMWGSVEFEPSLFEGMRALKADRLVPVEKVRASQGGRVVHVCGRGEAF
jgi:hypothetical protein